MSVHVFYTPHPDDETLGMAGAIARAKREGHRVVLVLLTDSMPSKRLQRIFRGELLCPIHNRFHVSPVDLGKARMAEFRAAARKLGVDEVSEVHIPEQIISEDRGGFLDSIVATVRGYEARYPGAVHHLVSGDRDIAMPNLQETHRTHRLCWEAGLQLAGEGLQVLFHRVYVYRLPLKSRFEGVPWSTAPRVEVLDDELMSVKRAALGAYQVWDPPRDRIAFAYHSVPDLFEGAGSDPHEYVDLP